MKPVDRQKICANCDGRIAIEAEQCPYCAAPCSIPPQPQAPTPLFDHKSIQDSLTSLYTPPYANNKSAPDMKYDKDKIKPKSFVKESHENQLNASLGKVGYSSSAPIIEQEKVQQEKSSFAPLLFLLLGGNLLIIALLQLFFSEGGILRLEWQSKYWYIYALIGLPVLYMGYKKAEDAKTES